jgi:hypothetical protein
MRFTNKKHATFKLCGARVIILGIVVKARAMSCLARARYFIGTRLFLKKHATSKNCLQVWDQGAWRRLGALQRQPPGDQKVPFFPTRAKSWSCPCSFENNGKLQLAVGCVALLSFMHTTFCICTL